jgi:hypothetical protein
MKLLTAWWTAALTLATPLTAKSAMSMTQYAMPVMQFDAMRRGAPVSAVALPLPFW